jgi:hypothetical protein
MAYYQEIEATTQIKVGLAKLKGIFASSGTSVTVAVYDSAKSLDTDPKVLAQFTAATPGNYIFPPEGLSLSNGLYVVLGGSSPKVTVFFE